MGSMIIDGRKVEFTDEKNILSIIRKAGIDVPTLCYQDDLSTFGDCRLCTVEDDKGKMFASCSEEPRDGMVIFTNTARLRKYRQLIIELMLAAHCRDCTTCLKTGQCGLQALARRYCVQDVRFKDYREPAEKDFSSPSIIRDPGKCILCGNCVRVCSELQSVGAINFANRGSEAKVIPAFGKNLAETDCVNCGQCAAYCPTGAITIRHNRTQVWEALSDPDIRVVAQIAPAVRVAVGDAFGMKEGTNVMGILVGVLHRMGFDEVYDTTFSADLTIMEETEEFLNRIQHGGKLPLLTSCCPAWVKFVGDQFPEYQEHVSTCRSPQGMLSAVVKEYFRDPANNPGNKKTIMVSIMPCTAKKMEAERPNSYTKGEKDTDYVLTSVELIDMIRTSGIDFENMEPEASDIPFGFGSGGGVIFGVTGGVTEAVIRRLSAGHDKETLNRIAESGVRQKEFIREFTIPYNGIDVNICVASGLANARKVMNDVKSGAKNYHLIEIMACQGGCVMGGGQPRSLDNRIRKMRAARTKGIYRADNATVVKKSDENPMLKSLYADFLNGKSHELLHNHEFCSK